MKLNCYLKTLINVYIIWMLGLTLPYITLEVIAADNDGFYKGTMSSADCGTGTLSVNISGESLTGTMVHSGTT